MEKEAKPIIQFPVIIPDDYSIVGFQRRNPDNFYEMDPEMIDRHFRPSSLPKAGHNMIAEIYELNGDWTIEQCINFIKKDGGLFPNVVGLTLAFEQGERYLRQLRKPWVDRKDDHKNDSQIIFGLDARETFWWQNNHGGMALPCLYSHTDTLLGTKWEFRLRATQLLGSKEDCLLLFREQQ